VSDALPVNLNAAVFLPKNPSLTPARATGENVKKRVTQTMLREQVSPDRGCALHPDTRVKGQRPHAGAIALSLVAYMVGAMAAGEARADLKLCNSTASRVGVSIGYQDQTGWSTEGWWNIASQTCETLLKGAVPSRFIYVHAVDYDRGGEWAGSNFMCTADKSFAIRGVQDCPKRGYKRTGFFEVDTGEAQEWTVRLTDPEDKGTKGK
jgi:uncharacterized membrane protein